MFVYNHCLIQLHFSAILFVEFDWMLIHLTIFVPVLSDQTRRSIYDAGALDLLDDIDDKEVRNTFKISRYFYPMHNIILFSKLSRELKRCRFVRSTWKCSTLFNSNCTHRGWRLWIYVSGHGRFFAWFDEDDGPKRWGWGKNCGSSPRFKGKMVFTYTWFIHRVRVEYKKIKILICLAYHFFSFLLKCYVFWISIWL